MGLRAKLKSEQALRDLLTNNGYTFDHNIVINHSKCGAVIKEAFFNVQRRLSLPDFVLNEVSEFTIPFVNLLFSFF